MKTTLIKAWLSLLVFALVGALVLMPVSTASADSGGGSGWLDAQGTGTAGVRGNGSIQVTGAGLLWVKDVAGDASIEVSGFGRVTFYASGWRKYTGFNGNASISGSKVEANLVGSNIHLYAEGNGIFYLRGRGSYNTSQGSGNWPAFQQTVNLE